MRFLEKIFGKKGTNMKTWKNLTEEKQLEEIIVNSNHKPIAIFKHSIRCGISAHAQHKLETAWSFSETDLDFYYLDLINYRNISNKIADVFGVLHQSPQVIIIKNEKVVSSFSHQSISVEKIKKEIN